MSAPTHSSESRILLLGASESRYGEYRTEVATSGLVACTISVGSDPKSPALQNKGHIGIPNEDALLVVEQGDDVFLAVADAHFGAYASHATLALLDDLIGVVPRTPAALFGVLRQVTESLQPSESTSAAALLVAVYRRQLRAGFGYSVGDASLAVVGGRADGRALNRRSREFIDVGAPASRNLSRASFFDFDAGPGCLVLAFTDGLDEGHYGHPETSLGQEHRVQAFARSGPNPESFARILTEWALAGRDGYPGGQDNLALVTIAT